MASPMRPTPTMPTRSYVSLAIHPLLFMPARPATRLPSRLRLEHRRQRLARVGELAGIERDPALHQPPRHRDVALRVDRRRIDEMRAVELEQDRAAGAERPAHARARLRNRPAHALDVHVVLLGPERGRDVVGDVAAGGVAAGDAAVFLRMAPVLQPHRSMWPG